MEAGFRSAMRNFIPKHLILYASSKKIRCLDLDAYCLIVGDDYQMLGLNRSAINDDIRKAYSRLGVRWQGRIRLQRADYKGRRIGHETAGKDKGGKDGGKSWKPGAEGILSRDCHMTKL